MRKEFREKLRRDFEIFDKEMKIKIIKAYKYAGSYQQWKFGRIKMIGDEIRVYMKKIIRDIIDREQVVNYLVKNKINIYKSNWDSWIEEVK